QRKREAQEAMAELALLQNSESPTPATAKNEAAGAGKERGRGNAVPLPSESRATSAGEETASKARGGRVDHVVVEDNTEMADSRESGRLVAGGRVSADGAIPRLRRIRASGNGEATRVTIDLEDSVQYTSARIANPERI